MKVPSRLVSTMLYPSRLRTQPAATKSSVLSKGDVVPDRPEAARDSVRVDTCPLQSVRTCAVTASPFAGEST